MKVKVTNIFYVLFAMAAALFIIINENNNNNENNNVNVRVTRRMLRDTQNLFNIPENLFIHLYRLTREAASQLCEDLLPYIPSGTRATAIPPHCKVWTACVTRGSDISGCLLFALLTFGAFLAGLLFIVKEKILILIIYNHLAERWAFLST
ncbi:hypothetical protein PUN28_011830 [Cardiocondyla obscurior]|uniref:Uncharacterized protein n=1 Tax=Cardiocondyla obscurior TaxID=286306 RepID=A0AAW2FIG5_9HYME